MTTAAGGGGTSGGERSSRLLREGLAIKREIESPTFVCSLSIGRLNHVPLMHLWEETHADTGRTR